MHHALGAGKVKAIIVGSGNVPLLHFMTNVVDAVAFEAPVGSMVPKLSVAGAVVTLHVPETCALTVRGVVPPAKAPVDIATPAARTAEASAVNLMLIVAARILLPPLRYSFCNPCLNCVYGHRGLVEKTGRSETAYRVEVLGPHKRAAVTPLTTADCHHDRPNAQYYQRRNTIIESECR
jgi:hypothetical protein